MGNKRVKTGGRRSGINSMNKFINLAERSRTLVENARKANDYEVWKTLYDVIFFDIIKQVRETNIHFEWCDPDTTYREDVEAFVSAIVEKADTLKTLLSGKTVDAA